MGNKWKLSKSSKPKTKSTKSSNQSKSSNQDLIYSTSLLFFFFLDWTIQICRICSNWNFFFFFISFIINSSLAIFYSVWLVPMMIVNLCSWEQNDSSRVWEVRFFCGAAKPTWWHWDYFGRELCFVNQLLHSWFHNSCVELRM